MRRFGAPVEWLAVAVAAAVLALKFVPQTSGWIPDPWGTVVVVGLLVAVLAYWLFSGLGWLGVNTALVILFVLGIVGLVEGFSYRHNKRWDLTENRRHSLSPQTIQLLQGLKADVAAVGFFRSDQGNKRVAEDLLRQYARYGAGRFTWKIVDPDREPGLARRYGVESYGTIVLETSKKSEKVLEAEEEKLTNGLLKVTREGKLVVYVLQGHGEHDPASSDRGGFSEARTALEKANYEVKPLVLARDGKVPDDAAVLVVSRPRTDLLAPEIDALDAYVGRGGKVLVMVESGLVAPAGTASLRTYLGKYGVVLGDNLVIELNPLSQLMGAEVPIIQQYESHPITRDLGGVMTAFPLSRTVEPAKTAPPGVVVQTLARTSPQSWGETNAAALKQGQVKPDPEDARGPLSIAAVATREKARIVALGAALASNQFLNLVGNRDFFLNTVSWLAEQEDQISIRPKDVKQTPVFLSSREKWGAALLSVAVLPGIALVAGIVTIARRRAAR